MTNDVPREKDGSINSSFDDLYIKCKYGNQIYSYGYGTLVAYIPSLQRGHNILKSLDENIPFNIEENDSEVLFKFKYKDLSQVAELLKASKSPKKVDGTRHYISPFSTKSMPKTKVKIPEDKLNTYKNITAKLRCQNENTYMLVIKKLTDDFIKSWSNNKKITTELKADMKKVGARGKDYIYLNGKWDDYIKYLEENI